MEEPMPELTLYEMERIFKQAIEGSTKLKLIMRLMELEGLKDWYRFTSEILEMKNYAIEELTWTFQGELSRKQCQELAGIAIDEEIDPDSTLVTMEEIIATLDEEGFERFVPVEYCPLTIKKLFSEGKPKFKKKKISLRNL